MSTPWEIADRAQRQLTQAVAEREQVARMLAAIQEERSRIVSTAMWCDLGEHAFSGRDRKRTTYKIETIDEETGRPVEDTLTACGACSAKRRALFLPQAVAQVPSGVDRDEYIRYLEQKNGIPSAPVATSKEP